MKYSRYLCVAPLVLGLSACITPEDLETTPVAVQTSQGVVTCQLYLSHRVVLDRAISRPSTMSDDQANAICLEEGKKQAGLS